jgi:glucose-6-phosphate isomerase
MLNIEFHQNFKSDLDFYSPHFYEAKWNQFLKTIQSNEYGFFQLKNFEQHLNTCREVRENFAHKKHFVHIGLGGSSLGPETFTSAINPDLFPITYINNIDSDEIVDQLKQIDLKNALFYVVSKSGGTPETLALFSFISEHLKTQIGDFDLKDYFVFATDPQSGTLFDLANEQEITRLEIPRNIGGRFSVLTPVGILPALFAGWDFSNIQNSIKNFQNDIQTKAHWTKNSLLQLGLYIYQLNQKENINQTVLMPYSSKLKYLSSWFVQLWAESLGKIDKNNQNTGLTPLYSYGPTDQHSQMQLFMEGPLDKLILFIGVENTKAECSLKNDYPYSKLKDLSNYSMHQLLTAELKGTQMALTEKSRPFVELTIDQINEENLCQLILFLESLTVFTGILLNVDPFDQPGVELGKKLSMQVLKG